MVARLTGEASCAMVEGRLTDRRHGTMRTIGYIRVSTQRQAESGVSIDAQREAIAGYCQAKALGKPEFVTDDGYSGKSLNRPGVQEVIRRAQAGEVDHVVVYALDRLSRRTRDVLEVVANVFDGRVGFSSIREDVNTTGAMGKFVLTLMGALAELERGLISERTLEAAAECRRQGRRWGQVPFGYAVGDNGKALVEDPTEFAVLERIRSERASGTSYDRIAKGLNADGIATKTGGRWFAQTVKSVLTRKINGALDG